jgi:1,2-dihydroxy-3-keto-5-methylthiopentene dioxygenase
MSRLRIYAADNAHAFDELTDHAAIARALDARGVRFERWSTGADLPVNADQEAVLPAYRTDIDRIMAESGFQSVDVVGLTPDHPEREAFRAKFLDEHTHSEFEIRFFVEGSGQFNLHLGEQVYEVVCEKGDLISVPADTPHWFDMGPAPSSTSTAGWPKTARSRPSRPSRGCCGAPATSTATSRATSTPMPWRG